jgi:hypothetical protein
MHPLNHIFAYHIDSITLTDGDYELITEPKFGNLTEAPNQSSENFDTPAPAPLKKASPRHKSATYLHCNLHLYIYLCIKFLGVA